MTPEEIDLYKAELRKQFRAGTLQPELYVMQIRALDTQKKILLQDQPSQPAERDFIQSPSTTSYGELLQSQLDFFNERADYYQIEFDNTQEEAVEKAIEDVNKKFTIPSANYRGTSKAMLSDIVDVEKGIVRDDSGKLRRAGTGELFVESLKRQPIGFDPEVAARQGMEIRQLEDQEKIRLTPQDFELPDDFATPKLENVFSETLRESGTIYESGLANVLRVGTMLPPAVAAAAIEVSGDSKVKVDDKPIEKRTIEETENYRKAESAEFIDQVIVNLAKNQGMINILQAAYPEYPKTAFTVGLGLELLMPLTGVPTALGAMSKLVGATGRAAIKAGAPVQTRVLTETISAPIETIKRNTTAAQVDLLFDKLETGKSSKEILNEAYKGMEWKDILNKELPRQTLRGTAASTLADRGAGLSILDALLETNTKVTAKEIRSLQNSTMEAFVKGLDDAEVVTRANITTDLNKELANWQKAVGNNNDWASIYNTNLAAKRTVEEILNAKNLGKALPSARLTTLTRPFIDELNRAKTTDKVLKAVTKKESASILSKELNRNLNQVLSDTDSLNLDVITQAFEKTLAKKYTADLLDTVPDDLIVLSKGIVIPTKEYKNKSKLNTYFEKLKNIQKELKFEGNKVVVNNKERDNIINMVIDYAGVATIRSSEMYQDFIKQAIDGSFDAEYYDLFVRPAIVKKVAGEVFTVQQLQTGGRQFKQASRPLEFRGDVAVVSETEQVKSGILSEAITTIKTFTASKKAYAKNNPTLAPIQGARPAPEFITLQKQINQEVENLPELLKKELQKELKKTGKNSDKAFNKFMEEAYNQSKKETLRYVTDTVNRAFNGNYKEYAEQFLPNRMKYINRNAEKIATEIRNKGDEVDMKRVYQLAVEDDVLYLPLLDQWKTLIQDMYRYADEKFFEQQQYLEIIRKKTRTTNLKFESRESEVLIPNVTNIRKVQEKILRTYGMKPFRTPIKKEDLTIFLAQEYILGMKQAVVVQKRIKQFLDTNPNYKQDLLPDYLGANKELNYAPLTEHYTKFIRFLIPDLPKKNVNDGAILAREHVKALRASLPSQRTKIDEYVTGIIGGKDLGQQTLQPDLSTATNTINETIEVSIKPIQKQAQIIVNNINRNLTVKLNAEEVQRITNALKEYIVNTFREGIAENNVTFGNPSFGITEEVLQQTKDFFRANGIAVGDDVVGALNNNKVQFKQFEGITDGLQYVEGQDDLIKTVRNLQDMAKSKKLKTTLEELKKADEKFSNYALYAVQQGIQAIRTSLSQGLLAGTYGPNTRYLGQNVFTAPMIMLGTIGAERTAKSMKMLGKATGISTRADDDVVFISRSGLKYTAKKLKELEGQFNIGLSRNQIELYRGTVTQQMNNLGLSISGKRLSKPTRFYNLMLNPLQRGLWSQVADATDYTYRRSVFYSALADDVPMTQAIDLAKRSLLDYGAISNAERSFAQKYVLFWSFTKQITTEFVNAMAKGVQGGSHNYILRAARASMQQQQAAGTWLYSDDRAKARIYSIYKGEIDDKNVYTFGFSNPYVETLNTLTNIAYTVSTISNGNMADGFTQIVQSFVDKSAPEIEFLFDAAADKYSRSVPPEEIAFMKATGMWPAFKETFLIEKVKTDKRRKTEPLFIDKYGNQVQYRMKKDGASKYAFYQFALLLAGLNRPMKDYNKMIMAYKEQDVKGKGTEDYGRLALPHYLLYAIGAETSIPVQTENEIVSKSMNRLIKKYNQTK